MSYNKKVGNYQKTLFNSAKRTVGLGILSGAGGYAIGSMSNLPGMPAQAQTGANAAITGLNLVNIGNLGLTGMEMAKGIGDFADTPKRKSKKNGLNYNSLFGGY